MSDLLQEYFDSRGLALRVDRQTGVIRGIKVLGPHSRNGRDYLPEALARAVSLYEGAKVNVNHPKGHPLAPRDYEERIGVIRNVAHRPGEGLFADFHFNPKHYLSEQLIWDAEHAPESVGFSHNVQARTRRQGERTQIEEILQVHSVDLVADPATTRGLFEELSTAGKNLMDGASPTSEAVTDPPGIMRAEKNDLEASTARGPAAEVPLQEVQADAERICQEQASEIAKLRAEIEQLRAKDALAKRRSAVLALLAEYELPSPDSTDPATKAIVSDAFVQSLMSAPDEQALRQLIEERAKLVADAKTWRGGKTETLRGPVLRDQIALDPRGVADGKTFARAITA